MDVLTIFVLFIGGIIAGLYGSSVGGGGLVTFPLLILSGLPAHIAIATNRFSATFLELTSAIKFHKEKKLDLKYAIPLLIISGIGSIMGSLFVVKINEKFLNLLIAVLLTILFLVLYNKDKFKIKEKKLESKNNFQLYLFTFFLSIYGGFFGGGFGTFLMFLLVFSGFSFIKSAALSRLIGFIMSLFATVVFALGGLINYSFAISLGLGCVIGSWIGVSIALKKGNNYVKYLLMTVVLLTIIKLLLDFFGISIV